MSGSTSGPTSRAEAGESQRPGVVVDRPGWLPLLSLVLSVAGLLVSAYLTYEHYTGSKTLACSDTGAINCAAVTSSQWSTFLGVPVALLGLLFFVGMTLMCLPVVWRRAPAWFDLVRIAATAVGMLLVFRLLWAEFYKIGAICLWCTGVHVLTFGLLLVLVCGKILTIESRDG